MNPANPEIYEPVQCLSLVMCPSHADFRQPLPVFEYSDNLRLWCVPFDLHGGTIKFGDDCGLNQCFIGQQSLAEAQEAA